MGNFFVMYLTCFLLGVGFTYYIQEKTNLQLWKTQKTGLENVHEIDFIDHDFLEDTLSLLKKRYYNQDNLEKQKINEGLINGLIKSIGDEYSDFFNEEDYKNFNDAMSGGFEGVGIIIQPVELGVKVEKLTKGSPAGKAGIKPGDLILSVDDKEVQGLSSAEVVKLVKGKKGTQVKLKIFRESSGEILEKNVTRDSIDIPSVDHKKLEKKDIFYVALNVFGEKTDEEMLEVLKKANYEKIKGIVLDLRGNGGGYLDVAVSILNNLVPKGELLVKTKYRESYLNETFVSKGSSNTYEGKIVVLIDEYSASASEIIAGALRENNKAILVGKKTFGKGSVQQLFPLKNNIFVKFTTSHWYTPNDNSIEKKGINPDIEVEISKEDIEKLFDRQKEVGIQVLESFIDNEALQFSIDNFLEKNPNYKKSK